MTTDPTQPIVWRHEIKHQINRGEDLVLSQRLGKLFSRDPHAEPDGTYRVTSLYFDTHYDTALRQKIDGVNRREKFRLRYYGTKCAFVQLEKKCKQGQWCGKRSARLTPEQARRLLAGNPAFLLDSKEPLFHEFYSKLQSGLQPKTIVCYKREAFLYAPGRVRITLDRDIRSGLGKTDFLNPQGFHLQVMEPYVVLEVKYHSFLPDLARLAVRVPGRQAIACSKYAMCRRFD